MNIFVLDTNPAIAASMHCDQHLHKMILESAQMLSTLVASIEPKLHSTGHYYKVTHAKHPCTLWLKESWANCRWLVTLCQDLDDIRMSLGADSHSSMVVINHFASDFAHKMLNHPEPESFIFCGPLNLQYNSSLTVPQKYQEFYKIKQAEWYKDKRTMTWKNRKIPDFMLA